MERQRLIADLDQEAAETGGYPHFMIKEINEQPAAITATVSPRVEDGLPDLRIPCLLYTSCAGVYGSADGGRVSAPPVPLMGPALSPGQVGQEARCV